MLLSAAASKLTSVIFAPLFVRSEHSPQVLQSVSSWDEMLPGVLATSWGRCMSRRMVRDDPYACGRGRRMVQYTVTMPKHLQAHSTRT